MHNDHTALMNIRCLIVDDEPLAQKVIETHIKKLDGWELAGKCRTAMEAFEVLHTGKIDVIFLDIQMPVITGLDFCDRFATPHRGIYNGKSRS